MFKEKLADYVFKHCIETAEEGHLMYGKRPGDRYLYQYYLSRLIYDVDMRHLATSMFVDLVETNIGHWNFQLTGREWSAIPLIIGIQDYIFEYKGIKLNAFMIKRQRKTYGIHNFIEGKTNDMPVLMVDDLCNSTNSFIHCKNVCKNLGLETVPWLFAILNKNNPDVVGESVQYDKYVGETHKCLYLIDGKDIRDASIRGTTTKSNV